MSTKAAILDAVAFGYLLLEGFYFLLSPESADNFSLMTKAWLVLGSLALGALASVLLNHFGVKTLGQSLFEPAHEKVKASVVAWYKTFWGLQLVVVFLVMFSVGAKVTHFQLSELFHGPGFDGAARIFTALLNPEWSLLEKGISAIIETIYIAFLSTVIAVPIAFVLSFLCARNIMQHKWYLIATYNTLRAVMNITRSIEPLIWAIIFSVWVGIGPFAGMLALMLHSVSSLVKQYSEIIECAEEGPVEGVASTGAKSLQIIWFSIVPQVVLPFISFTIFRWDTNVRMATIIGLVGGGGIGNLLIQYQGQALWREVGTLALLIVIVVWLMDAASTYIREALK